MQTKLLINGKLVAGEGKTEDVLNPATGKVLARVAEASRGTDRRGRARADAAFDGLGRHRAERSRIPVAETGGPHRG